MSSLPPVTASRSKDFRLIRPFVFVSEEVTSAYAEEQGMPITPCVCSHRTGTVRRSMREFLDRVNQDHPHVLENMLSAMSRIDTPRLLDRRFLDLEDHDMPPEADLTALPILRNPPSENM